MIERHFSLVKEYYGEKGAMKEMRKHVVWYTRGLPFSASFRSKLPQMRERESLFETLASYFVLLEQHHPIDNIQPPPLFDGRYSRENGA